MLPDGLAESHLFPFRELLKIKAPEQSPTSAARGIDLDKLAYAVACAETSCGTRGAALSKNNHFGIMRWKMVDGKKVRYLAHYADHREGYAEFKSIWRRLYGSRCPTIEDAETWTGKDNAETWRANVLSVYDCNLL